jgi:hypothetical protein
MEKEYIPPSIFEQVVVEEIRTGPFSILSETAQDRIIFMARRIMINAFDRGVAEGRRFEKSKKRKRR